MRKKKVLFLVAHRPGRSPGQRFRFEQYLDFLTDNGFECHISHLISQEDDHAFYANGRLFAKLRILLKSLHKRWGDINRAVEYDAVFLYREANMLGTAFFEKKLRQKGIKMVVDFDDSIWLKDVSNGNRHLGFLKRPSKTAKVVSLCDMVLVGNEYLANYARQYNKNVKIVPTTIDTDYYQSAEKQVKETVCIGWTGSSTTLKHLPLATPVLRRIREKYGEKVRFRIISDAPFHEEVPGLENISWKRETEVDDLSELDIGIMPLPDDEWSQGKCGFKGLQYMALEIPAVLSPVGVNKEIIRDGENGFLANTAAEWEQKLFMLIESAELRSTLGKAGRITVEKKYSFNAQKDRYLAYFNELTSA